MGTLTLRLLGGLDVRTDGAGTLSTPTRKGRALLAEELVADKKTKSPLPNELFPTEKIRIHGLRNGVMLYSRPTSGGSIGHWFMVAPPLTITDEECDDLLRRTEAATRDFFNELKSAGSI